MEEWKKHRKGQGYCYTLTDGPVEATVQRGDFGFWFWCLWDGDEPLDKGGHFPTYTQAMYAAQDIFNAYRADYNKVIMDYLMALSFLIESERPPVQQFKEGGEGIEPGAAYIFIPAGERQDGQYYDDTWISPLVFLGWQDEYKGIYAQIYFDMREIIFAAEQNKPGCDPYLRAAILQALRLPADILDLRIKSPGGDNYAI